MDAVTLGVIVLLLYLLNHWLPWKPNVKHVLNAVAFALLLVWLILHVGPFRVPIR